MDSSTEFAQLPLRLGDQLQRERGRLRAAGTLIGDFDLLIAATALHHTLTLLTNNRSHYDSLECIQKAVEGMTCERVFSRLGGCPRKTRPALSAIVAVGEA